MADNEIFKGKIAIGSGPPPASLQPPIIGYLYVDYSKPTLYVCKNNVKGNIVWMHLDEDEYVKLNKRIDNLNKLVNEYNKKLDDYMNGRWP